MCDLWRATTIFAFRWFENCLCGTRRGAAAALHCRKSAQRSPTWGPLSLLFLDPVVVGQLGVCFSAAVCAACQRISESLGSRPPSPGVWHGMAYGQRGKLATVST